MRTPMPPDPDPFLDSLKSAEYGFRFPTAALIF